MKIKFPCEFILNHKTSEKQIECKKAIIYLILQIYNIKLFCSSVHHQGLKSMTGTRLFVFGKKRQFYLNKISRPWQKIISLLAKLQCLKLETFKMQYNNEIFYFFLYQNGNDYKEPYYPLQYVTAQVSLFSSRFYCQFRPKSIY